MDASYRNSARQGFKKLSNEVFEPKIVTPKEYAEYRSEHQPRDLNAYEGAKQKIFKEIEENVKQTKNLNKQLKGLKWRRAANYYIPAALGLSTLGLSGYYGYKSYKAKKKKLHKKSSTRNLPAINRFDPTRFYKIPGVDNQYIQEAEQLISARVRTKKNLRHATNVWNQAARKFNKNHPRNNLIANALFLAGIIGGPAAAAIGAHIAKQKKSKRGLNKKAGHVYTDTEQQNMRRFMNDAEFRKRVLDHAGKMGESFDKAKGAKRKKILLASTLLAVPAALAYGTKKFLERNDKRKSQKFN